MCYFPICIVQYPRINSRYEIDSLLGHGGMGVVYKAYDTQRQGFVALKTMKDAADSAALPLFMQEWRTLANISHPNIVDVLDSGEFEEGGQRKPFFVMPLLPGRTLDSLIRGGNQLTVERIAEILTQACRGLQAAHGGGLIHRDLKPSNLFVMDDDSVKIIDFGMVHLSDLTKSVAGIKGTLQYMSPEQLEMKELTSATDIFSLGVVAYEALTGRKPFDRGSAGATAQAIRHEFPPTVSSLNPTVSKTLSQVVAKAMAKGPWNRYTSAREFGDYLQKAVRGEAIEAFDASRIQPRVERAQKALDEGDFEYATEILSELQSEGHADSAITLLVDRVNAAARGKSVRLLLDSARIRLREEEFPLAWQKVQEALFKDPANAEAQALQAEIESRRNDQQIDKWRRLVQQHLHNHAFSQARHAIEEIRKLTHDSVEASDLIAEVDRREREFQQTCEEREQQFQSAMRAYGAGEISTALSKLEKILEAEARAPGTVAAQRAEVYQQTYNKIRSEWEAVQHAVGEIDRLIGMGELSRAAELCARESAERPNDFTLQALKLQIEDLLRHEKSAYIAEIGQRVDAEPDLDKAVSCLETALQRYPHERTFEEALEVVRRRRDFVNSIVSKAHHYEEQNLIVEALGQWDTLRSIHPRYPGLDLEIERVRNRREQRRREDTKLSWVGRIDQLAQSGDYDTAADLAGQALADFPGDKELEELKRVALEGRERSNEARSLVERARTLCSSHKYSEGIALLRKASELDPNNSVVRTSLADALAEQARGLLSIEWRAAEPLIQEALRICPGHEVARSLQPSLLLARRNEYIESCISGARKLHSAGDIAGALAKVDKGLEVYPNDSRLVQLQNGLRNLLTEKVRLRRSNDLDEVTLISRQVSETTDKTALTALLERSVAIAKQYPGDEDFLAAIAAVREKVKADADLAETKPAAETNHFEAKAMAVGQAPPPRETKDSEVPRPEPVPAAPKVEKRARRRLSRKQQVAIAALPAVAMFLVMFIAVKMNSDDDSTRLRTAEQVPVTFKTNVDGAAILIDGNPVDGNPAKIAPGNHSVSALLLGYKPIQKEFTAGAGSGPVELNLEPEPHAIRISAETAGAKVFLDGNEIGVIQEGSFSYDLPAGGTHSLQLRDGRGDIFAVNFAAEPGRPAHLVGPMSARDQAILVVANLGSRAFAHSSLRQMQATAPEGQLQAIPPEGREFTLTSARTELTFHDGAKPLLFPLEGSNAPVLSVRVGNPTRGSVLVEANVDGATVFVNGQKVSRLVQRGKWSTQLGPGDHKIRLVMNGYNDSEQTLTVTAGKVTAAKFELTPVVTTAFLRVEGGTPDAEVSIDGRSIGKLDSTGSLASTAIPADVDHTIRLQKSDHEDIQLKKRAAVKDTIVISGSEARLRPFGTVVFDVQPADADLTVQQPGEAPRSISGRTLKTRQGTYTVRGTASGYLPYEGPLQVTAGQSVTVPIAMKRRIAEPEAPKTAASRDIPEYFESSPNWKRSPDGTWAHEGSLWMKDSHFKHTFEFQKIDRLIGKEKLRWVIYTQQGTENYYEFEADGSSYSRREVKAGRRSPWAKKPHKASGNSYRLQMEITPNRIVQKIGQAEDTIDASVQGRTAFFGKVAVKSIQ